MDDLKRAAAWQNFGPVVHRQVVAQLLQQDRWRHTQQVEEQDGWDDSVEKDIVGRFILGTNSDPPRTEVNVRAEFDPNRVHQFESLPLILDDGLVAKAGDDRVIGLMVNFILTNSHEYHQADQADQVSRRTSQTRKEKENGYTGQWLWLSW